MVDPRFDAVRGDAHSRHFELTSPSVVDHWHERCLRPFRFPCLATENYRRQNIMPIGKYVGLDDDLLAEDAFGGETAGVNLRSDSLDDDPAASIGYGRVV